MLSQDPFCSLDVSGTQVVLLLDNAIQQQESTGAIVGAKHAYLVITELVYLAFHWLEARGVSEVARSRVSKSINARDDARTRPLVSRSVSCLEKRSRRHLPLSVDSELDQEMVALLEEIVVVFTKHLSYT